MRDSSHSCSLSESVAARGRGRTSRVRIARLPRLYSRPLSGDQIFDWTHSSVYDSKIEPCSVGANSNRGVERTRNDDSELTLLHAQ